MLAYSGLCLAVFFWSINTVLARGVVFQIRPMALAFFRWIMALCIILPFAIPYLKKDFEQVKQHIVFLFFLSVPSVAVYNSIIYVGAQYTTATNISMVVATMPVITILFAWMMLREKPHKLQIFGLMVAFSGVLVIISQGSWQLIRSLSFNPGDILIVVSVSSWAFYSVLLKTRNIDISPISLLAVIIFFGTWCILPFYVWEYTVYKGFKINSNAIFLFLYLGICPSIISYICWNYGVKTAGASIASLFMYLLPIFTAVIAGIFLGEHLFFYHFGGGIMIFAGLILSSARSTG